MHSISTSVRIGSSFTATHVRHYDSSCQLERYFVLPSLAVHSTRWWETIENEIRQPQLLVWSWCHVFASSDVAIPSHSRASSSTSPRDCALKIDFEGSKEISTYRLRLPKEPLVHLIDGREVRHIRQEDIDLDAVLQRAARLLQHGRQVLQALRLRNSSRSISLAR